jgi:hypothetical protein
VFAGKNKSADSPSACAPHAVPVSAIAPTGNRTRLKRNPAGRLTKVFSLPLQPFSIAFSRHFLKAGSESQISLRQSQDVHRLRYRGPTAETIVAIGCSEKGVRWRVDHATTNGATGCVRLRSWRSDRACRTRELGTVKAGVMAVGKVKIRRLG